VRRCDVRRRDGSRYCPAGGTLLTTQLGKLLEGMRAAVSGQAAPFPVAMSPWGGPPLAATAGPVRFDQPEPRTLEDHPGPQGVDRSTARALCAPKSSSQPQLPRVRCALCLTCGISRAGEGTRTPNLPITSSMSGVRRRSLVSANNALTCGDTARRVRRCSWISAVARLFCKQNVSRFGLSQLIGRSGLVLVSPHADVP
jgi:hypothetical protein